MIKIRTFCDLFQHQAVIFLISTLLALIFRYRQKFVAPAKAEVTKSMKNLWGTRLRGYPRGKVQSQCGRLTLVRLSFYIIRTCEIKTVD
ncbi:MAG: hypothetical protein BA874_06245 [Desulfuromonadales bacterium C00003068]|nr:MAG: hypothetical protein BA874_06245 [Desulfuromonadales bacterium C00003068]